MEDNGRGIPVEMHEEAQLSALEVVLHEAGLTLDRAVVPVAGSGENYSFRLKKSALEADGNLGFSLPSGQFQEGPLQSVLVVEDSSTMRSLIASTLEESAQVLNGNVSRLRIE